MVHDLGSLLKGSANTFLTPGNGQPSDSIVNAPCFLPNALAGPYWVVAAGPRCVSPLAHTNTPRCVEWAF